MQGAWHQHVFVGCVVGVVGGVSVVLVVAVVMVVIVVVAALTVTVRKWWGSGSGAMAFSTSSYLQVQSGCTL